MTHSEIGFVSVQTSECVVVYSREVAGGRVAETGRPRPAPAAAEVGVAGVEGGRGVLGALPRRTAALSSCSTTQHAHHATCLTCTTQILTQLANKILLYYYEL